MPRAQTPPETARARPTGSEDPMSPTLPAFCMSTPWGRVRGEDPLTGLPEAQALAAAAEHGTAVAGLLPFDPGQEPLLMVPRRWERTPAKDSRPGVPEPTATAAALPAPRAVHGLDSPAFREAVAAAVARLHDGQLEKIVLSRLLRLDYDAAAPLDPAAVHRNLLAQHPRAYVFACRDPRAGEGQETETPWHLGASPELVMSVRDGVCTTHPLAGSASRTGARDATEDVQIGEQLMRSPKDRGEHATVIRDIARRLDPLCEEMEVPAAPSLLATPQLWHLGTRITGRLKPGVTALDAARAIHPTPAICGSPRDTALRMIEELEPHRRGFFGGLVGWCGPDGDGEWALNLRSARVGARRAVLFAGAGIVEGSTPGGEHAETGTKLSTFLAALGLDARARPVR